MAIRQRGGSRKSQGLAAKSRWATLGRPSPCPQGRSFNCRSRGVARSAGRSTSIPLYSYADSVPLGEAFWGDILGFTPAHSEENFAIVNNGVEYSIPGTPFSSGQAPCWVAKGAGNIWYTGNSPGMAISIFFSDGQGGAFYKSLPLPGSPTDITVSPDGKLLAVIYSADGEAYVAVYSIDSLWRSDGPWRLPARLALLRLAEWHSANSSLIHLSLTRRARLAGFFLLAPRFESHCGLPHTT